FPQGDIGAALADGELYAAFADTARALPYRYTFVAPGLRDARALGQTHTALFDAIGSRPRVALLEARHDGAPPEQQLWEELLRFYRYFGLDFSTGGARERPDHLLTEVEFMHYLTFLEAGAPQANADAVRRAQADFLDRHLARWLPGLGAALTELGEQAAPYGVLVDALARFVGADCAYLGVAQAGPAC
ncbi:molecular chaperone TorD family protein, partial [Immundisolibacter sp.]|uniref:molecular chaperone TorD family protein n=1 Tax=Immundisolibacter sp. TaxID=1934948 RepID=UPI00260FB00C